MGISYKPVSESVVWSAVCSDEKMMFFSASTAVLARQTQLSASISGVCTVHNKVHAQMLFC